MDRLLCGDVGYGKTEVALRAVMKCILDGKQAAILVPDHRARPAALCHGHAAASAGFPVNIEVLSRFRTGKQTEGHSRADGAGQGRPPDRHAQAAAEERALQGSGPARHRRGAALRRRPTRSGSRSMCRQVDVLTLSATPIPRTLNMALSGMRDMSAIEEPPQDRQPVQTYVLEHDWGVLARRACAASLPAADRSITCTTASRPSSPSPRRIGTAPRRGGDASASRTARCPSAQLSSVMQQLWPTATCRCSSARPSSRRASTFRTSTPSSSRTPTGWGLPSCTRSAGASAAARRRAYAYLTYRAGKVLHGGGRQAPDGHPRVRGVRLWLPASRMRDLEIRGAGNLLGPEQSGYMMSVGYDMYLQACWQDAVLEQQGEDARRPRRTARRI